MRRRYNPNFYADARRRRMNRLRRTSQRRPYQNTEDKTMHKKLTPKEHFVIVRKGTERPFSGIYNDHYEEGTYTCKRCTAPLFNSSSKFKSHCGWPSFDDQIKDAVK